MLLQIAGDKSIFTTKMKVVVVGAGITGAGIAHELHKFGTDVIVLESGGRGCCGATGSSWAWINANQKSPKWYQSLNVEGMNAWGTNEPYRRYVEHSGSVVFKDEAARHLTLTPTLTLTQPPTPARHLTLIAQNDLLSCFGLACHCASTLPGQRRLCRTSLHWRLHIHRDHSLVST